MGRSAQFSINSTTKEGIVEMTNFDPTEFDAAWEGFREIIHSSYNTGRGRKPERAPKNVLFMTLAMLKHGGQWDLMAKVFDMKPPTFERLVTKFIGIRSDAVYEHYVVHQAKKWKMQALVHAKCQLANYPMARYATDVTFQPSNRPSGNIEEGKRYFSKKHGMYGYKVEVSVLPNGLAIGISAHEPGSVSGLRIFQSMHYFRMKQMKKIGDEMQLATDGLLVESFKHEWAMLVDKGYQGYKEFCRAIHPTKKPKNGILNPAQTAENRHISSDRIIVEKFFGRLCGIWNVIGTKWRGSESIYDEIFRLCVGLTIFLVRYNPLRADDAKLYYKITNRSYKIGTSQLEKRERVQAKYRERRRRRVDMQFRANCLTATEDH